MIDYERVYKRCNKNTSWIFSEFERFCKEWDDICNELKLRFRKEVNEDGIE